jgi:hypothetical protein
MSGMRRYNAVLLEIFTTGATGLPVGVTKTRCEQNDVGACTNFGRRALYIVARRAQQIETGLANLFGIIEHIGNGRSAAFLCSAADFIASVMRPSLILPGEGFMSKLSPRLLLFHCT